MTPKDKARELTSKFLWSQRSCYGLASASVAKDCAKECIKQITSSIKDCGELTDELQNMDRTFAWWDKVYNEIDKSEGK